VVTVPIVTLVAVLLPETTVTKTIGGCVKRPAVNEIEPEPVMAVGVVPDSIAYGK
jgi:hypothetical protein